MTVLTPKLGSPGRTARYLAALRKNFVQYWLLYVMAIPMLAYYILFHYMPMYGAQIAFRDFIPNLGVAGSPWVGLKHFRSFFNSSYFIRLVGNTLIINLLNLAFGFPSPILLALLLNELRSMRFKRFVQTLSYLPHFISIMVVCGMIREFTASDGLINDIGALFGLPRASLLQNPNAFRPIYVISDVWQTVGWGSIIYIAALAGIDVEQYEAATIDGASRLQQVIHITLPGIRETIIILLILRLGSLMSLGFEKIILLYNPGIYATADVISSFVYRRGLEEFAYSYSSAVGLFNSLINFIILILANTLSKKFGSSGLW